METFSSYGGKLVKPLFRFIVMAFLVTPLSSYAAISENECVYIMDSIRSFGSEERRANELPSHSKGDGVYKDEVYEGITYFSLKDDEFKFFISSIPDDLKIPILESSFKEFNLEERASFLLVSEWSRLLYLVNNRENINNVDCSNISPDDYVTLLMFSLKGSDVWRFEGENIKILNIDKSNRYFYLLIENTVKNIFYGELFFIVGNKVYRLYAEYLSMEEIEKVFVKTISKLKKQNRL